MNFVHLHVHSPFSFLDGASDIETLVRAAAQAQAPALALTDHNSLAGAVRFHALCSGYGIQPILGAEITLADSSHLTLLASSRTAYANLCRLLTIAYAHGGRQTPLLPWEALEAHTEGLLCLTGCRKGRMHTLARERKYEEAEQTARLLRDWFGPENLYIELTDDFTPHCHRVCRGLAEMADRLRLKDVATNNVHYAERRDVIAHDILRCIHAGITVADIHPDRPLNFERWMKPSHRMRELFHWRPQAIENTLRIADRCEPALPLDQEVTPHFPAPNGGDEADYLRHLTYKGAAARYKTITPAVRTRLDHELSVITQLGYAGYMLLAWKIARWSRAQGIRCTGRGSAADSCVAYALMLTDVDVIARNLPFARFLAAGKRPDVDLDFDAARRDEVFTYIKQEWGETNTAMACTFHTYLAKSALRDVGKALALPAEALKLFARHVSGFTRADRIAEAFQNSPELRPHAHLAERFQILFKICRQIAGYPRHIGTHSSGVIISRIPLSTLAPMQPTARGVMPIVQLDKDDAETIGAIKLDILSLRILSAVQDAETQIQRTQPHFQYNHIPQEDPETYRLLQAGKALGAFQLESPAQMALAVILEPRSFEDLVASVALIRPGPIRSQAVKRFVACRNGWARADHLHPSLAPILAKTYGCVIFQEQVVQVIAAMLRCTDAEADQLRKRLAKHDRHGTMQEARDAFLRDALQCHPDLTPQRALHIWEQIETWSGYGFTEGHAASFALTAQKSAYLLQHHPAEYLAGMMSNQPMGYYSANTLAAEARRRGVRILPLDINQSHDKCTAETPQSIRLGFRLVEDLREDDIHAILKARADRPYHSLLDFCARVRLHKNRIENLLLSGAFDLLHPHRRGLLWRLDQTLALANTHSNMRQQAFKDQPHSDPSATPQPTQAGSTYHHTATPPPGLTLDLGSLDEIETPCSSEIDDFSVWDKFLWEWRITGVTAGCHPFAHLRERLAQHRVMTTHQAMQQPHGARVTVAGLNLRPHRPPTRQGRTVLFTTIEDETDFIQATCVKEAMDQYTPVFLLSPAVLVRGILQRKGCGASLLVEKARPLRMVEFTAPPPAYPASGTRGPLPRIGVGV